MPLLLKAGGRRIASAYALILDKFLTVTINDTRVKPKAIPLGSSSDAQPARDVVEDDGVRATLIAGLAERSDGEWKVERAGWYVLCNGRVVVFADKTELTGWGDSAPQFVSKFRGFVGIVFFFSKNPELLPWTTTKRGLHRESRVYQVAKARMGVLARPVLSFLNKMYPGGETEEPIEREIADAVKAANIATVVKNAPRSFVIRTRETSLGPRFVSVQYKAKSSDIERAKRNLRKSAWSAGRVGQHALEYFLAKECPE